MRVLLCFALVCLYSQVYGLYGAEFDVEWTLKHWGYPYEKHFAVTPDPQHFELTLFRVKSPHSVPRRPDCVCLLQHGFTGSAIAWIINTPTESLGFILADAGCDVWLGNIRGNSYSNASKSYNSNQHEYWDFSFDEMALYDLSTEIDYVLQATGAQRLSYIGHSQGTTMAFAGFGLNQSLADKVKVFVALAPVAFLSHIKNPLFAFLAQFDVESLLKILGIEKFHPTLPVLQELIPDICKVPMLCDDLYWLLYGQYSFTNHTAEAEEVYMLIKSGLFGMYDYGTEGNMKHYNSSTPPQYNLANVHLPIALFYGSIDQLADVTDVQHLLSLLPKSSIIYQQELPNYGHLDFNWGLTACKDLYPKVLQLVSS